MLLLTSLAILPAAVALGPVKPDFIPRPSFNIWNLLSCASVLFFKVARLAYSSNLLSLNPFLPAAIFAFSNSVVAANANFANSLLSFFLVAAIPNKALFNTAALSAKEPGVPTASDKAKATLPF